MKNKTVYILVLFTFCLINSSIFGQDKSKTDWVRLESENKEISFEVPPNYFYFFDKQGFTQSNPNDLFESAELKNVRSIAAYSDGAAVFFESYDVKNAQKTLPFMTNLHRSLAFQNISFENFRGLQTVTDSKTFTTFYYFASEKNIYLFGVGSRNKENETLKRFLNSLKLNGKSIFKAPVKETFESEKTLSFNNLQETFVEIGKLSKEEAKALEKKKKEAKDLNSKPEAAKSREEMVILFKPRVRYTDQARQAQEQGTIKLSIDFSAEGKIKKIIVVKGQGNGLIEQALISAKRIRFLPMLQNNLPIDSTKTVEYSFTIY